MALFKTAKKKLQHLGRYEVLERFAEGGMAEIYKGRRSEGGPIVCIKVLRAEMAADADLLQRFEREFTTAHRLRHPHIVQALDFGFEDGVYYLVMEFVEGVDLWHLTQQKGSLVEADAVRLITQVGNALQFAHEHGLIHRDVKPDNILVTATHQAKLTDLGLVKDLESGADLTRPSDWMGTPNFMAVEQFHSAKNVDARADVYSLGATLYFALTGKVPFEGKNLGTILKKKMANDLVPARRLVPTISEAVERAIHRATSADPAVRPRSCEEFVASLRATVNGTGKRSSGVRVRSAAAATGRTTATQNGSDRTRRTERRGATRYTSCLCGLCQPEDGDDQFRWSARVQDVSTTGIALFTNRRFEPGTLLRIELGATSDSPSRTLHGRVVRFQSSGPKKWLVGCALAQPLDEKELRSLQE
jgi:serine/threonine protein kinase